ncbi:hypothetical protein [uncultured Treponema sp.]|uniref:hypothetical protein n=1 Tax=uncultured Treponema sp. TaxID=162155 RepID=UPI0025FE0DDA|nr:hypothetical protein [uncultured Treponema sp.]
MNRFKNLFLLGYALFVIGMLAVSLTFLACSDSGDDTSSGNGGNGSGGSNSALAVFTCNSGYDNRTLTFYNDSTFKAIVDDESETHAVGTYTLDSGDWENGTISMTATSGSKADTFTGTRTISEKKIIFSSKTYTLTGGSLKTPSEASESGTKQDDESGANDSGNGNDGNNNNGNGGAATNTGTATFTSSEFYGGTIKIEYKADGTYLMTWALGSITTNKGKGTYTLTETFENGTIHQHQTHSSDTLDGEWVAEVEDNNLLVTNGSFTVQLEENGVLKDVTFTKTTSSSTGGSSDAGAGNNNGNGGASSDTEYNNSAVSSGKAAFKGTVLGEEIIVKFDSGKYEQWRNGLPDGKGTYSMTGDFTDGTMTLVEKEEYKSGEWQKKSSYETRNFTISNGTLKNNTYGTFEAIDYDYDVSRDRLGGSASDENTAAQFAAILYDSYNSAILTFHKDGTYEWVIYHKNKKLGIDVKETGTYSLTDGDFTNGTVTLKIHEVYSNEKEKMVSITDENEHPRCISRNYTSHSYISYIDEFTTEWKIENGKVTFDYYNTTTMIKQ